VDLKGRRLHDPAAVAPDVGASKRARALANLLDAPIVFIDKRRPRDEETEVLHVVGEVQGMDCVVVDDMITTGGTVAAAVAALKQGGAGRAFRAATHAVLTGPATEPLPKEGVEEAMVTSATP